MSDIWVVYGSTGYYEDHHEWTVCAYAGEDAEAKATRHVERATARVKERGDVECAHGTTLDRWCDECWDAKPDPRTAEAFKAWMGDLDPEVPQYDTTADYCAGRVTLRARVPLPPSTERKDKP